MQRLTGDCFYVRQGERTLRCFYTDILYVEASGCYCYLYCKGGKKLTIAHPLSMVEPLLPRDMFRRVHRSFIVNLREVEGFIGKAICIDKQIIQVSPSYREEVFACFEFWELKREKKK